MSASARSDARSFKSVQKFFLSKLSTDQLQVLVTNECAAFGMVRDSSQSARTLTREEKDGNVDRLLSAA